MKFRCPNCKEDVEVPEEKVIPYGIKNLVRADCPRCGCKGLLRWMKKEEVRDE